MWYLIIGFFVGLILAKISNHIDRSASSSNPDNATTDGDTSANEPAETPKPVAAPLQGGWRFCPQCAGALVLGNADGKERLKCTQCSFVHWDNPKPVAVILIPCAGGIVLVKRKVEPKAGFYALPGGFVDRGEDPWGAAVREAKEETGLDIEIDRLLGHYCAPGANQNLFFFVAKPVTVLPTAGDDAAEAGVYGVDELPDNIAFSSHTQMIERWLKETGKR